MNSVLQIKQKSFHSLVSLVVISIFVIACLITLVNIYLDFQSRPPLYRVTTSLICFWFALFITSLDKRKGVMFCIFVLPLLPTITIQIQSFTGYGRILPLNATGLDLVVGFFVGLVINTLFSSGRKGFFHNIFSIPCLIIFLTFFITISTFIGITRNFSQTDSSSLLFTWVFNLTHIRSIDWFDDYRPLVDWLSYMIAFLFLSILIPIFKSTPNRNDLIFKPLFFGVIIAASVGIIQSQTGIGLQDWQSVFRRDGLGSIALGFQPDIHAYAAHMMLGSVGLLGYLFSLKNKYFRYFILSVPIPLAIAGLVLSKSKSSLPLVFCYFFFILLIWLFRKSKYLNYILGLFFTIFSIFFIGLFVFFFNIFNVQNLFLSHYGSDFFEKLNVAFSYRPEIFSSAFNMFLKFPLLGLGQGIFYRLSSDYSFSKSFFLSQTHNGENAHNYFLQILVENGLIGLLFFILLVFYPIFKAKSKSELLPAFIGFGSILLGNIYSHSLLIRENLLVAFAFIALMYSFLSTNNQSFSLSQLKVTIFSSALFNLTIKLFIISFVVFLVFWMTIEIHQSNSKPPFLMDVQCSKVRPIDNDGWTGGTFELPLSPEDRGIRIQFNNANPKSEKKPIQSLLSILDASKTILVSKDYLISSTGDHQIEVILPENLIVQSNGILTARLELDRCFIPKNIGMNSDNRRLGVHIHEIKVLR